MLHSAGIWSSEGLHRHQMQPFTYQVVRLARRQSACRG